MKHNILSQQIINCLLVIALLFVLVSCGTVQLTNSGGSNTGGGTIGGSVVSDPDGHNHQTGYQLDSVGSGNLTGIQPISGRSIPMVPHLGLLASPTALVQMEILVIAATEDEIGLAAVESLLKQVGVPYNVLIASEQSLTNEMLMNGDVGRYQGIILTTGSLTYDTGGGAFASAFEPEEWQLLWAYESNLGIRQVALFNFPSIFPEDYGIAGIDTDGDGWANGNGDATNMAMTAEGQAIFKSIKPNADIPVLNSFKYPSVLDNSNGVEATPILLDSTGNILGVTSTSPDGRERMALTMAHNPNLLHTQAIGYDMLNWLTQGVFIGERRMYLSIDVDDWFLRSVVWNPATLRPYAFDEKNFQINAKDVYAARDGVLDLRSRFSGIAPYFTYNQVYNARSADLGAAADCSDTATLTGATLCTASFFPWVSHTFTHAEMDYLSYNSSRSELFENIKYGLAEPLEFDKKFLVTGKHSGLGWSRIAQRTDGFSCEVDQVPNDEFCQFGLKASNTELLKAAIDLGVTYLAANRGWNTHQRDDGCDTCLIAHPLDSRVKLVPRWPANIFFNTTTPEQNTSEFNFLYGPTGTVQDAFGNSFFNTAQTWNQILDFEATVALRHIMSFSPYPHFFHQANLYEYSEGRSLLYDWSEAVISAYDEYFSIPLISQDWHSMTDTLEGRTEFFEALKADAIRGVWNPITDVVTIESDVATTVYVTGAELVNAEAGSTQWVYGGDKVSKLIMTAGQTVSGPQSTTITTVQPTVSAIGGQSNTETETVAFTVNATDAGGSLIEFSAIGLPDGISIHPETGKISGILPVGSAGNYNVTVTASNRTLAGTTSFSWNIGAAPVITTINENFATNNGNFSYRDGMFNNAENVEYYGDQFARGYRDSGDFLVVELGGRNNENVTDMAGGWEKDFTLSQAGVVTLSMRYRFEFEGGYETDEYSELYLALNGRKVGLNGKNYIVRANGGPSGTSGRDVDTGWRSLELNLGKLTAGTHSLQFGGYNNKKTYRGEITTLSFDDVVMTAKQSLSGVALAEEPTIDFSGSWEGFFQKSGTTKEVTLSVGNSNSCYDALRLQGEDFDSANGVRASGTDLYGADHGEWVGFNNINLCEGFERVTLRYSSASSQSGSVEFRKGSRTGTLLASAPISPTGNWNTFEERSFAVTGASGQDDIYLVFKSDSGNSGNLVEIDWIEFSNSDTSGITAKDTSGTLLWKASTSPVSANVYEGLGLADLVTDVESGLVDGTLAVINNNVIHFSWLKPEGVVDEVDDNSDAASGSGSVILDPNNFEQAQASSRQSYETVIFYRKQYSTSTTLTPPVETGSSFPTDPTVVVTDPPVVDPPVVDPPVVDPPTTDPPVTDPPATDNLLKNADFENGLASWDLVGCGDGTSSNVADATSGTSAMQLSVGTICIGQGVASAGADTYSLSCDVKNVGGMYADMSFYADSTNIDYKSIAGSSFTTVTLSGDVSADAQSLYVYFYSAAGGEVVIDNCILQTGEVTTTPIIPTDGNLLSNASFEDGTAYWNLVGCGNGEVSAVADASEGSSALQLSTNTVCTGQSASSVGAGTYTLTCDVKNTVGVYADISLYGDFSVLDFKAITANTYTPITLSGVIDASVENIYVYVYQGGAGQVLVDNCSLTKQ